MDLPLRSVAGLFVAEEAVTDSKIAGMTFSTSKAPVKSQNL